MGSEPTISPAFVRQPDEADERPDGPRVEPVRQLRQRVHVDRAHRSSVARAPLPLVTLRLRGTR